MRILFMLIAAAVTLAISGPSNARDQYLINSADVLEVEQGLELLGYFEKAGGPYAVDGVADQTTGAAIWYFQKENGFRTTNYITPNGLERPRELVRTAQAASTPGERAIEEALARLAEARHQNDDLQKINDYVTRAATRANDAGFVYRSPMQWVSYHHYAQMRRIFEGQFDGIEVRSYDFAMFFNAYVAAFSRECQSALPPGSKTYTFETRRQVFDGLGFQQGDYVVKSQKVAVRPELVGLYERFRSHPDGERIGAGLVRGLSGDFFTGASEADKHMVQQRVERYWLRPLEDMTMLLTREGCTSPAVHQFEANLARASRGQPAMQETGIPPQGSAAVTTSADMSTVPQGVGEACIVSRLYVDSNYPICRCAGLNAAHLSSADQTILMLEFLDPEAVDAQALATAKDRRDKNIICRVGG